MRYVEEGDMRLKQKWRVLCHGLKAEGTYFEARLDPHLLCDRAFRGYAAVRETDEIVGNRTIIAYGALWPTSDKSWLEVGSLYVHPAHRKNGLHMEIMSELVKRVPEGGRLFLITADKRVMQLASDFGFVRVSSTTHPNVLRWASEVGIVCRLPKSVHKIGWPAPEANERWLFIRGK
ncbi:MAG: hypothetical protein RLZZ416_486 [Candidatus Parcubacteria bacterium]